MTSTIKTCRGVNYEEIVGDGTYYWLIKIRKPFYNGGKFWFSLNDKFFQEAEMRGVSKFIVMVGEKEIFVPVLSKKELEVKEMRGEVEIIPSKFEGMSPWRRYLFPLEDYNKSKVVVQNNRHKSKIINNKNMQDEPTTPTEEEKTETDETEE